MKRKTEAFLLLLSAALIYLLCVVVFRPRGRYFVFCSLTEYFWLPALGALLCILIGGAALSRHSRRKQAGKSAKPSGFAAWLLILLAAVQAGVAVYRLRFSPEESRLRKIPGPDGQHCIYRYSRSDLLGNSCYVFLVKRGMFFGEYLFDFDKELPQIEWNDDFLTFGGTTYHLAGDVINCS